VLAVSIALVVTSCAAPERTEHGDAADVAAARNVILVSLDTLRADRLSCYGYPVLTSPTLDRLAREGVRFTNAVATSPWTLPSHASLLTGLYPHRHGATGPTRGIPDEIPVLAEALAKSGFATAGFVSSSFLAPKRGLDRGFETYRVLSEWGRRETGETFLRNPGTDVTDAALAWLHTHADERFFLFLHYYDAHADYAPPARHRAGIVGPYDGPASGTNKQLLAVRRGQMSYQAEDVVHVASLYDAEIRAVDAELARVIDFLDAAELTGSTLVVVTSDHGEEFLERGSVLHGRTYYQEVISIPLVLRGPGVPAAHSVDAPVSLVDVAPTVLARTGVDARMPFQGTDLAPLWVAGQTLENRHVMAEADWQNSVPGMFRMVRDGRYKLIHEWRTGRSELYDLREDPGETKDLSRIEPRRHAALLAALADLMTAGPAEGVPSAVSPDEIERMRVLGYLD